MGQRMTWGEICGLYPGAFVLLHDYHHENLHEDKVRILDGEVVFSSSDPGEVYHRYLSQKDRGGFIFGYTGWDVFVAENRPFLGIRPSHE